MGYGLHTIVVTDAYTTRAFVVDSEVAMVGGGSAAGSALGSELVDWWRLGNVIYAKLLLQQLRLLGLG